MRVPGADVFANLSLGAAQTVFTTVPVGLLAGAYLAVELSTSRRVALYVGVVGVLALAVTVLFLVRSRALSHPIRLAFAGWFLGSLGGLGGVLEGRRWGPVLEAVRLAAAPLVLAAL